MCVNTRIITICGLVGIAGDIYGDWKDIFTELLLFDVVRGPHSTGAGFVKRSGEYSLAKRPGNPFNLFETDEYQKAMANHSSFKALIGHNRFATIGEKTEANAHPFEFSHIIGAHNGTLDKETIRNLPDHHKYGTDSEAIFASINATSVKDTMKLVSGAWALTYYDHRDNTINLLTNGKRPLHYCYSADRCTMIWSSELELLRYVLSRRSKKLQCKDADYPDFYAPTINTLFSWKIPKSINEKFDAPTQIPVEGKKYVAPVWTANFTKGSTNTNYTGMTSRTDTGASNIIPFNQRKFDTTKFRHPYKDMYGKMIKRKCFESMVKEGCAFCNSNGQEWGEFIKILGPYVGPTTPYMCDHCYNNEDTYEIAQYAL